MSSFDISSDVQWQEITNAIQQAKKEFTQRFDFKGVDSSIEMDIKAKTITIWTSQEEKLDAVRDIFQSKLVKRGVSLLSFNEEKIEAAFGGSVRQVFSVQAGISKDKGKEIIAAIKETKIKVQAQIQDEQIRVTGKNRDDLQEVIAYLKAKQDTLKIPMQFGNFRS